MDSFNFSDIFSKDMLAESVRTLDLQRMLIALGAALVIGLFTMYIYNKTFSGVLYSRSFALSLVVITLVTTLVMLPITSNLSLSLGMVGALSIIRFRTAVKDAMDAMFLFWGVAEGISLGAGFYQVAIVGGLVIGLSILVLSFFKVGKTMPYMLVIHFREEASRDVNSIISSISKSNIKSKVARRGNIELSIEVRLDKNEEIIVDKLASVPGVHDATLMSYQGAIIS